MVLTPGRRSHRGTEQGKTTVSVVFTGSLQLLARIVSGPRWRLGKCEYVLGIKLRFLNQPPVVAGEKVAGTFQSLWRRF